MKDLTSKRQRFVTEYLVDLNATQAAIRAGYSEKTAKSQGQRLLTKVDIANAISKREGKQLEKNEITAERVLAEVSKLAFSDMDNFAEWGEGGVNLKSSKDMDTNATACVSEVSQTITKDGGAIRFKLHDKVKALDLLGKHLSLFNDKVEHGNITIEVKLPEDD